MCYSTPLLYVYINWSFSAFSCASSLSSVSAGRGQTGSCLCLAGHFRLLASRIVAKALFLFLKRAIQPVAGGSKAAMWMSRAALHKPVGCLLSNIHCTVKASQDFEISLGQISLEFNTNGDNTFVSARHSWKSLYTTIPVFHLSLTRGLAKVCVFHHWCYFLEHHKSKFVGNSWPQIAFIIPDGCGAKICVWWSGNLEHTFVVCGLWFLIPSEAPALQRSVKLWVQGSARVELAKRQQMADTSKPPVYVVKAAFILYC